MKIILKYYAQIRHEAGLESETVEVPQGTTVIEAIKAAGHGTGFFNILFNEQGNLRPIIMIVLNGLPCEPDSVLQDGAEIQLFSPVSGG